MVERVCGKIVGLLRCTVAVAAVGSSHAVDH